MPRTHLFSTLAPPTGVIRPFPCSRVSSTHPADSTGGIQLVTEHPGAKRWCQHAQSRFACRSCLLLLPCPVKQLLGALVWALGVTGTQRQTWAKILLCLQPLKTCFPRDVLYPATLGAELQVFDISGCLSGLPPTLPLWSS